MTRAQLVTRWVETVRDGAVYRNLEVAARYPHRSCVDVTDQPSESLPPTPNAVVVEVVVEDAVFTAMEADPNLAVLWSEEDGA
jgi:hypothetical protein